MKRRDIDQLELILERSTLHNSIDPVLHYFSLKRPEPVTLQEGFTRMRTVHSSQTLVVMLATKDPNDPVELIISTKGNSLAVNYQRGCDSCCVYTVEELLSKFHVDMV